MEQNGKWPHWPEKAKKDSSSNGKADHDYNEQPLIKLTEEVDLKSNDNIDPIEELLESLKTQDIKKTIESKKLLHVKVKDEEGNLEENWFLLHGSFKGKDKKVIIVKIDDNGECLKKTVLMKDLLEWNQK